MSLPAAEQASRASSDYGSDIAFDDNDQLRDLLEELEARHKPPTAPVLGNLEDNVTVGYAIVPIAAQSQHASGSRKLPEVQERAHEVDDEGVRNDAAAGSQRLFEHPRRTREASAPVDDGIPDTRTPLERFRTTPKKPLSVTDLVSPAWCELQYWYTLSKFGKKKRTPAMKQGSSVHKKLEEEVHTTIAIDVQTREDSWGLRIWNIVQGLRTLKATGITRELEIWGIVDGQVVNGVIDELSYSCTDLELEARLRGEKPQSEPQRQPSQSSISQFLTTSSSGTASIPPNTDSGSTTHQMVYLTDVKTRGSNTVPTGASLRPTIMQLMLYRKILSDLASGTVNEEQVFDRYRLDPDASFSDSLIAQLGSLDQTTDADSVSELLAHNSLRKLWQLMLQQLRATFPHGADSISRILRADFRNARDGSVIGAKTFVHDGARLQVYITDEMRWWKGEREARGVDVEEAFKCRICEFAEGCAWRNGKIEEAVQKSRARSQAG